MADKLNLKFCDDYQNAHQYHKQVSCVACLTLVKSLSFLHKAFLLQNKHFLNSLSFTFISLP